MSSNPTSSRPGSWSTSARAPKEDDGGRAGRRAPARAPSILALAALLALFVPGLAAAGPITSLTVTTSSVGDAQISQHTDLDTRTGTLRGEILLPEGDPYSSGEIAFEFDLAGVTGTGSPTGGPTPSLLFGTLGSVPASETLALGGDPVPWNLEVALVRLDPDPEVVFYGDASDTQTGSPIDGFEWADTGLLLADGRYRFAIQVSQVGGEHTAGVSSTLFAHPIPEPGALLCFGLGLPLVGSSVRRHRRASGKRR